MSRRILARLAGALFALGFLAGTAGAADVVPEDDTSEQARASYGSSQGYRWR